MSKDNFNCVDIAPPISEFIDFRVKCGWGKLSPEAAQKTLEAGLANTSIYDGDKIIGFGRVIGDGAVYFYIQDLIVSHHYQGLGLGTVIMKRLIEQISKMALPGASIGLMSALDKEEFYKQFGFKSRPSAEYGAGMTLLLDDS